MPTAESQSLRDEVRRTPKPIDRRRFDYLVREIYRLERLAEGIVDDPTKEIPCAE